MGASIVVIDVRLRSLTEDDRRLHSPADVVAFATFIGMFVAVLLISGERFAAGAVHLDWFIEFSWHHRVSYPYRSDVLRLSAAGSTIELRRRGGPAGNQTPDFCLQGRRVLNYTTGPFYIAVTRDVAPMCHHTALLRGMLPSGRSTDRTSSGSYSLVISPPVFDTSRRPVPPPYAYPVGNDPT